MAMSINTNVMSLNAQRHLISSQAKMGVSMERLASGLRINSAKDDAAGLAVSQKMLGQIKSLDQAVRNANDGISMIQTAEGGMQEAQTMLQRMRELATQGASDSISDAQRGYINTELQELYTEINDLSKKTTFNGQNLLDGSLTTTVTAGSAVKAGLQLNTGTVATITELDVSGAKSGLTFTLSTAAAGTVTLTDNSTPVVAETVTLSDVAANGEATIDFATLGVSIKVIAGSAIKTAANLATDLGALTTFVTEGSGTASLQVGANKGDTLDVSFSKLKIEAAGDFSALHAALTAFNAGTATRTEAEDLLAAVDTATDVVSGKRAALGAKQNRLIHTIANLQITSENTSAARGRIVDTDYAAETASLTRSQILQQAGTAMLAQANASPQTVLAMLQ